MFQMSRLIAGFPLKELGTVTPIQFFEHVSFEHVIKINISIPK